MVNSRNIPDSLQIPTTAVAPEDRLTVETRALTTDQGTREAGKFDLLAIGWYQHQEPQPEPFAYLVRDPMHNEVFWVAHSMVEAVRASR